MRIKKISLRGLLIDLIPNSPTNITQIVWQILRRITHEIMGVKGLTTATLSCLI